MKLRTGWVVLIVIAGACGKLSAQTTTPTPKLTFRQIEALSDDDKNKVMIAKVNALVQSESDTNPEEAGEMWELFYPELANYISGAPKSAPDGKAVFWKLFFEAKGSGRDLDSISVDDVITVIVFKGTKDALAFAKPTIPSAPPVQPLTWADLQNVTEEKRAALIQRPMHEMVAHAAVRNPARAKFIEAYFFDIPKNKKTSVGADQFNKELAKYKTQIDNKTLDPASVRLDRIAEEKFEEWEGALQNFFWTSVRADASYTFMLAELKQRKKELQERGDRIECHAVPLSDGRKAFIKNNGELVDGTGKALRGTFLAEARAFDFSSPSGQRYLAKCLKDHGLSPDQ